tara:strand:- start:1439 stop:1900 length:462 start_codon:yes stop_codon:yes gene_type:complete
MSTVKSSSEDLTLNADGAGNDVVIQGNGTNTATITAEGLLKYNSGYGSVATAYGCRAWVNFDGTGTVAIRGSGNVSSIIDYGTGSYGVTFATAMPDTNYGFTGAGTAGGAMNATSVTYNYDANIKTTAGVRIYATSTSYTLIDGVQMNVAFYR